MSDIFDEISALARDWNEEERQAMTTTPPTARPEDICSCGHVRNEHDRECTVEHCKCVYFEATARPGEPRVLTADEIKEWGKDPLVQNAVRHPGTPRPDEDMRVYPVIMNGDHAEFEREHANTPPKERPDWPLPSFDAKDWAEAFCKAAAKHDYKAADGMPIDAGWMTTWFANALMRGYDEHAARASGQKVDPVGTDTPVTVTKAAANLRPEEVDKFVSDLAAQLDPQYVQFVSSVAPILRENIRLRARVAELEKAAVTGTNPMEGLPPAPWSVDPDEREGMEWNMHVLDANGDRICFMANRDGYPLEATARAIAAIPDREAEIARLRKSLTRLRSENEKMREKAAAVVDASDDFREGMGPEWGGDALTDAVDELRTFTETEERE